MNEQDNTLLDQYFNGLLPPEESRRVRERAAIEADFAAEFALRQQMDDFPRLQARRESLAGTLGSIGSEFFSENKQEETPLTVVQGGRWRWLATAASLALLAVAAWFLLQPKRSLYEQYASHGALSFTERGATDALAQQAETAFNAGDYAQAYTALAGLLAQAPDNLLARLYAGISLLELKRPGEARTMLAPLADGTSALRADAIWYTALAYVQEENWTQARETLAGLSEGDEHYEAAEALRRKLEGR